MLLNTLRQEVGLAHAIHFWLGKASSPVRDATLALHASSYAELTCPLARLLPRRSFVMQAGYKAARVATC